jgi:hypothetical protein
MFASAKRLPQALSRAFRYPQTFKRCHFSGKSVRSELVVASAQMHPNRPLSETLDMITTFIEQAATKEADVLLLPEAVVPGYNPDVIRRTSPQVIPFPKKRANFQNNAYFFLGAVLVTVPRSDIQDI